MEFEEIIKVIEDVDTLKKICLLAEKKAWEYKFNYKCAKSEIKELKELNEKLQKLLGNEKVETAETPKIDTVLIQMGGMEK